MARQLDDWLFSYMHFTEETEPHPTYRRWCAISAIATALARRCYYDNGEELVFPNFYIVLVGKSSARKSTAMRRIPILFEKSGLKINRAPATTTRERLIQVMHTYAEQEIVGTGRTIEHTSLIIHASELAVFIGQKNFLLINDLADWYDCPRKWDYETKTQGMFTLTNLCVNMLGAITPEMIQAALPMEAVVGGLTQRMVMVFAPGRHKIVTVPVLDPDLEDMLANDLGHIGGLHGEYKATTDFLGKYAIWYASQSDADPTTYGRFDGYVGRRQVLIQKLAMVSCASRGDKMYLEGQDFDRALNMLEEVEILMPNVFAGMGKSPLSGTIHKVMMALLYKGSMTKGELLGLFHNDVNLEEMDMIITMLELEGKVIRVTGGNQETIRIK